MQVRKATDADAVVRLCPVAPRVGQFAAPEADHREVPQVNPRIHDETAMPDFLATKGVGGWPDIEMGGPGFCFPVWRWNGKAYALNRFEYEGKRCKPER